MLDSLQLYQAQRMNPQVIMELSSLQQLHSDYENTNKVTIFFHSVRIKLASPQAALLSISFSWKVENL